MIASAAISTLGDTSQLTAAQLAIARVRAALEAHNQSVSPVLFWATSSTRELASVVHPTIHQTVQTQ